jgi:hypothetical protein
MSAATEHRNLLFSAGLATMAVVGSIFLYNRMSALE